MNLIYEGEYLNGKKNGKGKIFYKSYGISEDEYFLGEKSGSNLIFEGEFLNGKKSGKGKEYNGDNSNLIYEGEYLNWKKMEKENNMIYMVI